jgi:hypothetical protein
MFPAREGILRRNWDKNPKTFAPCYSQSPPPEDFTPPYVFFYLGFLQATAESGRGLCFVYIISLFTFESSIDLSLITIY